MIAAAYRAGAIAAARLEAGAVFLGPTQAADAAGFTRNVYARQLFIVAYLATMPAPIQTGVGNRIIRIGSTMPAKIGPRELALREMRERMATAARATPSRPPAPDRKAAVTAALAARAAAPVNKKLKKKRRK